MAVPAPKITPLSDWVKKAEQLEFAVDWFHSSSCRVEHFLDSKASDRAMIFRKDHAGTPRVFYVCKGHLSHRLFGEKFRIEAIGSTGIPEPSFREPARQRYQEALWLRRPVFDRVSGQCNGYFVEYQRALIPLKGGFLASVMHVERILRGLPSSSERYETGGLQLVQSPQNVGADLAK